MKVNKKIISIALAVLCLLSCCSFFVSADDDIPASDFDITLKRQVTEGSTTSTYNFDYTVSSYNAELNIYRPVDYSNFWASGGSKIFVAFNTPNLIAGHEYQLTFTIGVSFNANYTVKVLNGSQNVFEDTFRGARNEISVSFTAPDYVSPSHQVSIILTLPQQYGYGTASTGFYFSKSIGFNDNTDNPGWLGKILQNFTHLGDRISGFFSNLTASMSSFFSSLGDRISGFFDTVNAKINDFKNNVSSWFSDLKETIKQKFVDLGNDIGEFFEKLKNYLLYFQHPVTTNSDGVLIGSDGKPVYTNPFESALQKVEDTVYDWLGKISDFLDSMEQSRVDVAGYLENGSTLVNGVLKASPALAVCLTFAVGFFVIRKVVGR